ncbi:oligosaccharide flippase family protein [Niallia taxi]|uniref:oligosaccharide flippase family protein n=1 Tax=Niallia taxi TaxID=2499688 RepID=UPI003981FF15
MSSANAKSLEKLMGKYNKDTLTYIPAILVPALVNVLSIMIFTRAFSTAEFGLYNILLTTTQLGSMVMSQWIMQSVQYYRPNYLRNNNKVSFNRNLYYILVYVSIIILVSSLFIYLVSVSFFSKDMNSNFHMLFWCTVFLILLQGLLKIGLVLFQSDLEVASYRYYQLVNSVVKFGLSIILVYFVYKNIISIFVATIISIAVILIPIFKKTQLISKDYILPKKDREYTEFLRSFINYGFPMIGWFIGTSLLNLVDKYMIGFFRGNVEVGIYSANSSIVFFGFGLLSGPLLSAAHPIIMNSVSEKGINKEQFQNTIESFSRIFLITMVPVSFFITIFRADIATLLLGSSYRDGADIIPIILFGFMAWHFSLYGHKVHEIYGKTKQMVSYVVIAVVVNIIFNFLLIPTYGYMGATIATFLGYITYPIAIYISSRKLITWKIPWKSLIRISVASIVTSIITYLVTYHMMKLNIVILNLIIGFIIYLIVYIAILIVVKEVNKKEVGKIYKKFK